MKLLVAALAASVAAMLLLVPWPTGAQARAAHGSHFFNHLHASRHNGTFGSYYWPFYSGALVTVPSYAPAAAGVAYAAPPSVVYVAVPPRALTCHRSRQTVTVPAEAGGTRQITVTRC
jgi:hypothetical protein